MSVPQWPADRVERRSVSSLVPYARNARTHSDEQVAQIAASIREWGWTVPVLVDEAGGIIAGHGRVMAARKLGLAEVPVMVAAGWTEAQRRAYVLADNKLAMNAGWDDDLLGAELSALTDADFNVALTGFELPEEVSEEVAELEDVSAAASVFWIAVKGPFAAQAEALAALKALALIHGVEVDSNLAS